MSTEFGKDLGLIHEMVVTGRKAKMTPGAYAFLAHNEAFFGKVAGLVRHQAILEKEGIEATPINEKLAEKLIQDVYDINGGCIRCFLGQKEDAWGLYLPYGFGIEHWNDGFEGLGWEEAAERYKSAVETLSTLPEKSSERDSLQDLRFRFSQRVELAFRKMLTLRLSELGLHPAELVEFSPAFQWESDYKSIALTEGCYEYKEYFAAVIRQLVKQRAVLALLNQ